MVSIVRPARLVFSLCIRTLALCCLEFYKQDVTDGMRSPMELLVDVASKSFQKVVTVAEQFENTVQPVCFHSSAIKDVDHEASWLVLLNEVQAPKCSVTECGVLFVESALVDRSILHVCVQEEEWKFVHVALERNPIYISNSTCVISQMACGRPGDLQKFSGVITVAKKFESTIQPILGFCLHSSANKDVAHDDFVAGIVGRGLPA